jgi:hypothetical protein
MVIIVTFISKNYFLVSWISAQIEQMSMLKTKTICFPYYIKKTV